MTDPQNVPDEWVRLAVRANADRNHVDLCGRLTWPERCATGYTPTQWEHGDEAHTIAAVVPEIQRQARERLAATCRDAAKAIEDSRGEADDPLAAALWDEHADDTEPRVVGDPRSVAATAYRHLASRLTEEGR